MTRKYKLIVIYEVSSKTFEGFEKSTDAILKYGVTNFGDVITDQYTIKNVLQISEGTNSVGIVRWDLGFCLCAVMRGAF